MADYGLVFKGQHSLRDYGFIMKSVDRSLLPAVKRQQVDIPFLDSKFDLQTEPVYDNRIITVALTYHFNSPGEMQEQKRAAAAWLSGKGRLVFDDEPQLYYEAKVFDAISIEQGLKRMQVQVGFECEPYAMDYARMQVDLVERQNQRMELEIEGNVKTCGKIMLTNTGGTILSEFALRRERMK